MDTLNIKSIQNYLTTKRIGQDIELHQIINSTNLAAKQAAAQGCADGLCIISLSQTQGRGRLGRSFYSPAGSGVYFSVVLRPNAWQTDPALVTVACATAVSDALEYVCGIPAQIKWVNDIYCDDKKLCGILVESSGFGIEGSIPEYMVIGIGINLKTPPELPHELQHIVTSVKSCNPKVFDENQLVAEVLNHLEAVLDSQDKSFLKAYRSRSCVLGHSIFILNPDGTKISATAMEIDDSGALIAELQGGKRLRLHSGEISIRLA